MSSILKKIFCIIVYGLIYFVLEKYFRIGTAVRNLTFSYAHSFLMFVSVIQGSLVGGFSFALGSFLLQMGQKGYDWILIICSFLNCASIGFFMRAVDIRHGFWERKDITRFNTVQWLSNVVCWSIVYPAAVHFIHTNELFPAIMSGLRQAIGYSISGMIAASLFLVLYAQSRISEANFHRY